jgi:hypothetical protein
MTKQSSTKTPRATSKNGRDKGAATSKLDTLVSLLRRPSGASILELSTATNWQKHSVRGALAGTLKKKGHSISSEIVDGTRRYRIEKVQA